MTYTAKTWQCCNEQRRQCQLQEPPFQVSPEHSNDAKEIYGSSHRNNRGIGAGNQIDEKIIHDHAVICNLGM